MSGNAGEMLSGVLRILHAQRKYIRGDAARTHAYHAGHRYWREFYAQKFVTQEALSSDRQGKSRLWSGRLRILRQAPVEFIRAWTSRYRAHPPVPRLVSILAARVRGRAYVPATGRVHFGDLRRTTPLSPWFGFDRGLPIDRYYIQRFLAVHWKAIRGRTMEVGDDGYTQMYGRDRVARCDVLHVSEGNPRATIVADLSNAPMIPSNTYDCIVLTQTLHLIYDVQAALQTLFRILKPGGVLLATVPGVSQISNDQWGQSWYWGFTQLSLRRLLEEHFPAAHVTVEAHGNVLAGLGFLEGMAAGDFTVAELDFRDPQYEVLITALASKPRGAG
jgi:hypothetical protein